MSTYQFYGPVSEQISNGVIFDEVEVGGDPMMDLIYELDLYSNTKPPEEREFDDGGVNLFSIEGSQPATTKLTLSNATLAELGVGSIESVVCAPDLHRGYALKANDGELFDVRPYAFVTEENIIFITEHSKNATPLGERIPVSQRIDERGLNVLGYVLGGLHHKVFSTVLKGSKLDNWHQEAIISVPLKDLDRLVDVGRDDEKKVAGTGCGLITLTDWVIPAWRDNIERACSKSNENDSDNTHLNRATERFLEIRNKDTIIL